MKTYLTEHIKHEHLDTPRIKANNWEEAELKCPEHLIVIGELKAEYNTLNYFEICLN